jgi:hypothetical protein
MVIDTRKYELPVEICREINEMIASEDALELLVRLYQHKDASVRGAVVEKLMDAFPRREIASQLQTWLSGERDQSIRVVINDYLGDRM